MYVSDYLHTFQVTFFPALRASSIRLIFESVVYYPPRSQQRDQRIWELF